MSPDLTSITGIIGTVLLSLAKGLNALRFFLGESATVMTGLLGSSEDVRRSRTGLLMEVSFLAWHHGRNWVVVKELTMMEGTSSTRTSGVSPNH